VSDQPQVYTAKAAHERFLGAPGLRLIPDRGIVRQTILKALSEGKLAVRLADGRAFGAGGCVEGPDGRRRGTSDTLTTFALDDTTFITPIDSPQAAEWLKVDKPAVDTLWPRRAFSVGDTTGIDSTPTRPAGLPCAVLRQGSRMPGSAILGATPVINRGTLTVAGRLTRAGGAWEV
jgi:hypothetical protein